jgi:hypothetical protein
MQGKYCGYKKTKVRYFDYFGKTGASERKKKRIAARLQPKSSIKRPSFTAMFPFYY